MSSGVVARFSLASICFSFSPQPVWSQTETVESEHLNTTHKPQLEEILVVSSRYQSELKQLPVSAHVITGQAISQSNILDMSELSVNVPNLIIGEGVINTNIYMRGIGSGTNRAFEQSVGMYIDDVYMGRGRQYRAPFLDVQQVEVFRGPQGVLFGKNAIAGAVAITTARASAGEEFNGSVQVDYDAEYEDTTVNTVLSSGLGDNFGIRFANKTAQHNGYFYNTYLDQKEPAIEESISRLSGVYDAGNNFDAFIKYEQTDSRVTGTTAQLSHLEPLDPVSELLAAQAYLADPKLETQIDKQKSEDGLIYTPQRDTKIDNAVITLGLDAYAGRWLYNLGYSQYESHDRQDGDQLPLFFIAVVDQHEFDQNSHELRYQSDFSGAINFQAGAYYQHNNLDITLREDLGLPPPEAAWFGLFESIGIDTSVLPPTPLSRATHMDQDANSNALFAEIDWQFSQHWQLQIGGRYTYEEKSATRTTRLTAFTEPDQAISPAGIVTAVIFDVDVRLPYYQGTRTEEHFTPSAKLLWQASERWNLYGKYESAVKAGGFNSNSDAELSDQEFEEETAQTIELGAKGSVFNDRVDLNAALFRTQIKDLQVTNLNGARFLVGNAAEAISQGLEFDARWQALDSTSLSLYGAWLDAYYSDYPNGPCPAIDISQGRQQCDLTGNSTPFAPKWSAGLALDYRRPLNAIMDFYGGVNLNFSDDYYLNFDGDPLDSQSSYTKLDLQVGLEGEHWQLGLVGKNLTDEAIASYGLDTPLLSGGHIVYLEPPRTVELRLAIKF